MADTTKLLAEQSFFVFVKDVNTGKIRRIAIPSDVQVGLKDNPAELQLLGRLSLSTTGYSATSVNGGSFNISSNDTIVSVSLVDTPASGRITLMLPSNPRDGQLHFIKDITGTADTVPIDITPSVGTTIDSASVKTLSSEYGLIALYWQGGEWRVLIADMSTSSGGAPTSATYVTVSSESSLSAERVLAVGTGLLKSDSGPNSNITLSINDGTVATVSGTRFTGPVVAAGGISGSLQRLVDGTTFIVAGSGITVTTQSSGQVVIAATGGSVVPLLSLPALAGVETTNTAHSGTMLSVGSMYYNPTIVGSFPGTKTIYWRAILDVLSTEPNMSAAIDLYDVNGITKYPPGQVTNSALSSSNSTMTQVQANLTTLFNTITGSGIFEARLWRTVSGSLTSSVSCRNARIDIEYA